MYNWEIEQLLKLKEYILFSDEYLNMVKTSPQIERIKYNPQEDTIEMWTKKETNPPNYFKYKVKLREPK